MLSIKKKTWNKRREQIEQIELFYSFSPLLLLLLLVFDRFCQFKRDLEQHINQISNTRNQKMRNNHNAKIYTSSTSLLHLNKINIKIALKTYFDGAVFFPQPSFPLVGVGVCDFFFMCVCCDYKTRRSIKRFCYKHFIGHFLRRVCVCVIILPMEIQTPLNIWLWFDIDASHTERGWFPKKRPYHHWDAIYFTF